MQEQRNTEVTGLETASKAELKAWQAPTLRIAAMETATQNTFVNAADSGSLVS